MEKLREELRTVKSDLGSAESDRVGALDEVKVMQQLMFQSKEADVRMFCNCMVTIRLQNKWLPSVLYVLFTARAVYSSCINTRIAEQIYYLKVNAVAKILVPRV